MIDWGRVDELHEEIGAEDFGEVVELFLEEVEEVLARLSASVDTAQLRDDMHFLKGSSLNLGFRGLAELCAKAEKAAARGQSGEIRVESVLASFAASKNSFLDGLAKLTAA